ncbi:MAG: hypothetical protein R3D71_06000 [Rickettsiales bacterium]
MRLIDKITANAAQKITLNSDDGEEIKLYLRYLPSVESWSYELNYKNYTVKGERLVLSPNILRKYKNLFLFGIAIISEDGLDPSYIDDFATGRVKLYLLSNDDKNVLENEIYEKI